MRVRRLQRSARSFIWRCARNSCVGLVLFCAAGAYLQSSSAECHNRSPGTCVPINAQNLNTPLPNRSLASASARVDASMRDPRVRGLSAKRRALRKLDTKHPPYTPQVMQLSHPKSNTRRQPDNCTAHTSNPQAHVLSASLSLDAVTLAAAEYGHAETGGELLLHAFSREVKSEIMCHLDVHRAGSVKQVLLYW